MKKVALITGATRGIGRSIALHLGQSGYQVVVNGTKPALINEVVEEIHHTGGEAIGYCANVADPVAVTSMVDDVIAKYGHTDVLIHNAGNLHDQHCLHMTDEAWTSVLDVHLNGAFYCIQRVLPHMQINGGDILLMTSTAGLAGSVGQMNYSAAKAGMLGIVWTLAAELKANRIRVNAISPAALTDMTRPVIEHIEEKYASRNEPFPDFWRVGEADDIARFVLALLAQPDADLTGEILGVNGSRVTKWHKPAPAFSEHSIEAFFTTWQHQKGSN
ncbi:SDR family NAD(P)-dependent oxidoreductase [Paenibacillus macquariensis]|uniref:3-oxoacyl-[acyl-carrier protein] reductase n=1 Tax=Paenibacillus macquariensis TaxID=948756 RepID=A0ABY1JQ22_9BACL|nr:SDR family NAD(P)-dependent oxidoreductase [Paenibacillus macquariensis]MEC0094081.1 SDR family oxidoreductase [Paenibacillus macquariensis]OAB37541.1 3-oxoacyl-ACP reductase [Paenibacillus macquariensis subsp. macquariensis]SIQ55918.1 3-oxoacyl-[acyl-carrier protein] reductase [Paenibacillus macquariensis]